MKICFDISYIQRRRAGIGRCSTAYLASLLAASHGHEFILHGWSRGLDIAALERFSAPNVLLKVARIPGAAKRFYWRKLSWPGVELFAGDIDIFQSMDPLLPPARRARRVATVHDLAYKRFPEFFDRSVLALGNDIVRSLSRADAIVVPSSATKSDVEEMLKLPSSRVHVVAPPLDPIFSQSRSGDKAVLSPYQVSSPYILFVGTMEPRKNVASLVRAFEILHARRPLPHRLILVGKKGWLCRGILEAIRNSPVREKIRRLDYISDQDLPSFYRSADLFVYPSFYEGFGLPVFEAMASGTPVITSNIPSMQELAGRAALMVDPLSVDELASAMISVLEDDARRAALVAEGTHRARELSSRKAGSSLLSIYESLAGS